MIEITYDALAAKAPGALDPRPTLANIGAVLNGFGDHIRFDEFSRRILVDFELGKLPAGEWTDAHTTALTQFLERLPTPLCVSPGAVDRAVVAHAKQRAYNALTDYALECAAKWDGVARVDQALATYWGAADTDATRIASRVFFLSLAARALEPGCKVDTCVCFPGGQGALKSSSFRALVSDALFSDDELDIENKDGMQDLPGTWAHEFSEAQVLGEKKRRAVKAYLSKTADRYRPSYGRHTERVPRQTVFVATTNDHEFLSDPTGNRRFPVVQVGERIDLAGIRRDREQLIGEAVTRAAEFVGTPLPAETPGAWWPTPDEERTLARAREAHEERDPWLERFRKWIAARGREPFSIDDILAPERDAVGPLPGGGGAVPHEPAKIDKRIQGRAAAVLRALRYERKRCKSGARRDEWLWEPLA